MKRDGAVSILIIEDVDAMRDLLGQVVGALEGVRVSGLARNGWEARIELTRRRPDLVLLDEILPGESSVDLLAEMAAVEIPVILLTGIQEPQHPLPEGVLGRLVKPSWEELRQGQGRFERSLRALFTS